MPWATSTGSAPRGCSREARPTLAPVPSGGEPWIEPGLEAALEALSEPQRVTVVLRHSFEWTYGEIAELLEVSVSTVRNHLARGMEKLRTALEVASDAELERRLRAYGRAADDKAAPVTVAEVESAAGPGSPRPTAVRAGEVADAQDALEPPSRHRRGRGDSSPRSSCCSWATAALFVTLTDDGEDGLDIADETDDGTEEVPATTSEPPPETATTVPDDPWAFTITYIEALMPAPARWRPTRTSAWVPGTNGVLSTIDLATNEAVDTNDIPPGAGHANFGFESVWINHDDGTVSRFDPGTGEVVATIPVGGDLTWLQPGEDSMWVGTGVDLEAVRIDPATNEVSARIPVGGTRPARSARTRRACGIKTGTDTVVRIDPATNEVVATVAVDTTLEGALWVGPSRSGCPVDSAERSSGSTPTRTAWSPRSTSGTRWVSRGRSRPGPCSTPRHGLGALRVRLRLRPGGLHPTTPARVRPDRPGHQRGGSPARSSVRAGPRARARWARRPRGIAATGPCPFRLLNRQPRRKP